MSHIFVFYILSRFIGTCGAHKDVTRLQQGHKLQITLDLVGEIQFLNYEGVPKSNKTKSTWFSWPYCTTKECQNYLSAWDRRLKAEYFGIPEGC